MRQPGKSGVEPQRCWKGLRQAMLGNMTGLAGGPPCSALRKRVISSAACRRLRTLHLPDFSLIPI
jgi:hypothetical protein